MATASLSQVKFCAMVPWGAGGGVCVGGGGGGWGDQASELTLATLPLSAALCLLVLHYLKCFVLHSRIHGAVII